MSLQWNSDFAKLWSASDPRFHKPGADAEAAD
jgi:hypothetical protein